MNKIRLIVATLALSLLATLFGVQGAAQAAPCAPREPPPRQFETTHPSRRVFLLVDLKKRWFYNKHLLSTGVL